MSETETATPINFRVNDVVRTPKGKCDRRIVRLLPGRDDKPCCLSVGLRNGRAFGPTTFMPVERLTLISRPVGTLTY